MEEAFNLEFGCSPQFFLCVCEWPKYCALYATLQLVLITTMSFLFVCGVAVKELSSWTSI